MRMTYWRDETNIVHIVVIRWEGTACNSLRVLPSDIMMDDALVPTCLMCIAREPMYGRIIET